MHTPTFLQQLGLDAESADERAVKRAYAKRLKAIDPAAEPEAFQALRQAYETAQVWLEHRLHHAPGSDEEAPAQHSAGATDPLVDAEPAATAVDPSWQVFDQFLAHGSFADEKAARAALDRTLGSEQLINLEARMAFEWRIAALLLDGWKPGHEFLFWPACQCFDWERDRRRLSAFGHAGAALDAAIRERMIFFRQAKTSFDFQRKLIRSLRDDAIPEDRALARQGRHLRALMQSYPHWLRIIAPYGNYMRRMQAYDQLPARLRDREEAAPAPIVESPPPRQGMQFSGWSIFICVIMVISAMSRCGSEMGSSKPPATQFLPPLQIRAPAAPQAPPTTSVLQPGADAANSFGSGGTPGSTWTDSLMQPSGGQAPRRTTPVAPPLYGFDTPAPSGAASQARR